MHDLLREQADLRGDAPGGDLPRHDDRLRPPVRRVSSARVGAARIGLESGDRVGILLDKRVETVVAIFGTSAAEASSSR